MLKRIRVGAVLLGAFVVACVVLLSREVFWAPAEEGISDGGLLLNGGVVLHPTKEKYVAFTVCGNYEQQRLSISYGIMIGKLLNRTVILPEIFMNYMNDMHKESNFDSLFQSKHLVDGLRDDIPILPHIPLSIFGNAISFDITFKQHNPLFFEELGTKFKQHPLLTFSCPIYSINLNKTPNLLSLSWKVQKHLEPNQKVKQLADELIEKMKSKDKNAVCVYYPTGSEWMNHCKLAVEDGCYTPSADLIKNTPLHWFKYKSWYVSGTEVGHRNKIGESFSKVSVFDKFSLIPEKLKEYSEQEDLLRAIDFEYGLQADDFLGTQSSIYSSLLSTIRKIENKPSSHYDYEQSSLNKYHPSPEWSEFLNNGQITWVMSFNGENAEYTPYLKAAVNSAIEKTTMKKVCIYDGKDDSTAAWLRQKGVKVIFHTLSWESEIEARRKAGNFTGLEHPTYSSTKGLTSTFMRTDLPLLSNEFDSDYVLYTDLDVVFLDDIRPRDIQSFPLYFSCPAQYDENEPFPCNAGVMFINIPNMKSSHAKFLSFIRSNPRLDFPNGPTDQGALNTFYEGRMGTLSTDWNWRPYWKRNSKAKILHYEGPKPKDYEAYFKNKEIIRPQFKSLLQNCDRGADCKEAMRLFYKYSTA